jgi:LmbE family N-acetylglucosaminyl deacetylase
VGDLDRYLLPKFRNRCTVGILILTPVMSSTALFISPHPDDIAFSIGGIVRRCGFRSTLFTVFGISGYAPKLQDKRTAPDVTRLRQAEDQDYARASGLSLSSAFLPAASSRVGMGNTMLPTCSPHRVSGEDAERMLEEIRRVAPVSAPIIFLPAALKGHRDHVICREFFKKEERYRSSLKLFYEDLPYALALSEAEIGTHMAEIQHDLRPITVPIGDALSEKCIDIGRYASQVDAVLLSRLREAAFRYGSASERVWVEEKRWCKAQTLLARRKGAVTLKPQVEVE